MKPIAPANIQLELPEFDPKKLPEWAEEFAEFLLLTGQSHVDVTTKCSLLKRSCKKKFLQKQVKEIVKTCLTWAEVLQRLEKTFPVYETDLSVRTQIAELPMLLEFPPAARISDYVGNLEYLFSRMNVGDRLNLTCGLWVKSPLVRGRIAGLLPRGSGVLIRTMTWWTCSLSWLWRGRTTPIWKNSSRGTWGEVPTPPLIVVSREGPKSKKKSLPCLSWGT